MKIGVAHLFYYFIFFFFIALFLFLFYYYFIIILLLFYYFFNIYIYNEIKGNKSILLKIYKIEMI